MGEEIAYLAKIKSLDTAQAMCKAASRSDGVKPIKDTCDDESSLLPDHISPELMTLPTMKAEMTILHLPTNPLLVTNPLILPKILHSLPKAIF